MHSRCNGSILLGTISICVALAIMEPDINMKKPFGPKMCECFCRQISGCSSCIYRTSDLSCHPMQAKSHKQKPGKGVYFINATKDKESMDAENAKCKQGWKMFDNRRGILLCRPILSRQSTLPSRREEREDGMTRILMCPSAKSLKQGRLLYLNNNSVVEYPYCRASYILAAAYISSQRELVMSTKNPRQLFFMPIDGKNPVFAKTEQIKIDAIAIDDHKQLVFMMAVLPKNGVYVMSTDGTNITSLFSLVNYCISHLLVADPSRSLIYVLCPYDYILQITYQGVSKGKIGDKHVRGTSFCLDMQGDRLFYQDRKSYLHTLSLSDHTDTTIHTSKIPLIFTMLTVGSILYMNPFTGKLLLVVNMNHTRPVTKINTGSKDRVAMCLIP